MMREAVGICRVFLALFLGAISLSAGANSSAAVLVRLPDAVPHRGAYEIDLKTSSLEGNPFLDTDFQILLIRPDRTRVTVDGFYDGDQTFKARAYADTLGKWQWHSLSNVEGLNGRSGQFQVVPSELPGKLRKHPVDSHQFMYDSGQWFLHIGDTGYRYVTDTEPQWQAYIDQAAEAGFTKIRTWFCRERSDVQALFAADRSQMNLSYWQEIDRRLVYALNNHPHVMFQVIPYGEDTAEIERYGAGDRMAILAGRYAQARFSALPNVTWCLTNDHHITSHEPRRGRDGSPYVIDQMGMDFKIREPWGTLLTNHQMRFQGYHFVDAPWSDIITLEDLDQVAGAVILHYRAMGDDPVILDEDRYELYRPPAHPRYFFRRMMWASLLSGGAATYGGLKTYEPYDGNLCGVQGYADAVEAGKLTGGARDFRHIHRFFEETDLTLVGMEPADAMVGYDPQHFKCIANDRHIIVYLANPDLADPQKADARSQPAAVKIHLPVAVYAVRWYEPMTGRWVDVAKGSEVSGGIEQQLKAPFTGDAVLYLRRQ